MFWVNPRHAWGLTRPFEKKNLAPDWGGCPIQWPFAAGSMLWQAFFAGRAMRVYCFKTNVCSEDYLEKILPHIHDNHKIGRVEVNRDNEEEPLLFIETDLSEETVAMIVKSAGFEAIPVPM